MEQRKTNESANAGQNQDSNIKPGNKNNNVDKEKEAKLPPEKEIDVDDLVHEPGFEPTAEFNKDTDEPGSAGSTAGEKDADDRVHGK